MTTPESMLQAIIERQCAGGYEEWKHIIPIYESGTDIPDGAFYFSEVDGRVHQYEYREDCVFPIGFLEILLDPSGLKVAYGHCQLCDEKNAFISHYHEQKVDVDVAHKILDTWLGTSSPEATIKTAFSLLPTV